MEVYEGKHLSNILVCEFEDITKKGGMCVIKVYFSQPGWCHRSKMEWNTTVHDNRRKYNMPIIPLKVTTTCNILNHSLSCSTSHRASIVVDHHVCWQSMSTDGSLPKRANNCSTGWPMWLMTILWWQFRILGWWFTNCHWKRQLIRETGQIVSSGEWVWLPSFTPAISWCATVLSPFAIQHDTKPFATNQQHKPRISKLWATEARIRHPPRWLWQI